MRYLLLLLTGLSLSGCAETGRLLGNVTMIPARVITGNMYTDAENPSHIPVLEEATPIHMSE